MDTPESIVPKLSDESTDISPRNIQSMPITTSIDTVNEETTQPIDNQQRIAEQQLKDIESKIATADPIPAKFYKKKSFNLYRVAKIQAINMILKKFQLYRELPAKKRMKIAISIECGCYNDIVDTMKSNFLIASWNSPEFCDKYNNKCYNTLCNLDPESFRNSGELAYQILEGDIKPENVGTMNSFELCATKHKEMKLFLEQRTMVSHNRTLKTSKLYTCPYCKKSMGLVKRVQTRSLDEGYTIKVICVNCWRTYTAG